MKVLHIINNLRLGGAEKLLVELLPLLQRKNHDDISILLLSDTGSVFVDALAGDGIDVKTIKFNHLLDPRNVHYLKKHFILGDYDIVHVHLFPAQLWVALASRSIRKLTRATFVTTEHSPHNWRRKLFLFRYIDRWMYDSFDAIISVSCETKTQLQIWLGKQFSAKHKMLTIPNGVNQSKIKSAIAYEKKQIADGIDASSKLIFMAGRFVDAKDQKTLIQAMTHLPVDYHLILAGDGPLLGAHKAIAEKLSLARRVHFLGYRDDIARLLKSMDIVVQSSNWEGLSLAAVEGMAAGKPVLASRVEGLSNVIMNDSYLFEKGNARQLADKISALLSDGEPYRAACQYSCERAGHYDITATAEAHADLYHELRCGK
ncbi:MAG: glycosyltransferase [Clostridiales bacterium]|nr:glycosyltransferase [Clostridiales bacterium]